MTAGEETTIKRVSESEEGQPSIEKHYLQIPVPRLMLSSFTSPKGLLLLILLSYVLSGFLYLRIRHLEGGTSGSGGGTPTVVGTTAKTVNEAFIDYAKNAKMDTKKFAACLSSHTYKTNITKDSTEGIAAGINATPGFIVNGTMVVGAQPFSAFQAIIDQELSRSVLKQPFALIPPAFAQTTTPTQKITVSNGHLPVLGKKNAKVTIVEFSDFQCPFCKQFFTNTFAQIKKTYIDTGKANLYYRQYPLTSIHPNAQIAAEASECANEQGKFWQFHDILFTNQDSWASLSQTSTTSM